MSINQYVFGPHGPEVLAWHKKLVDEATDFAKSQGFSVINLDVRATQERAIHSFEACGFKKFGENPNYAYVDGAYVTGYYYSKEIR